MILFRFFPICLDSDSDLRFMIQNRYWGPEFNKKEAEIRQLKVELARIDADKQHTNRTTITTQW